MIGEQTSSNKKGIASEPVVAAIADQVQKQQQAPKPPSQTSLASMLKKVFNRMVWKVKHLLTELVS